MTSPDSRVVEPRSTAEPQRVVPTTRARQGVTGHNVRYVLGFGLFGIVVAFGVIYLIYFA